MGSNDGVTVWIDWDLGPVYLLVKNDPGASSRGLVPIELSKEEIDDYDRVTNEFGDWQTRLERAYKAGEPLGGGRGWPNR